MPVLRPRRLLLLIITLPFLFLALLFIGSPISRRNLSVFLSTSAPDDTNLPAEIFGLLHLVTAPEEAGRVLRVAGELDDDISGPGDSWWSGSLSLGGTVVPEKPVEMAWYALGSISSRVERGRGRGQGRTTGGGWGDRMEVLQEQYPVVVFSKSYCPYSKRAKKLLESYNLSPPPKVIEVDLRADSPHIKTLLTRLTNRSTFPNVILHGRSLGGSDELVRMHEEGQLKAALERGGVKVRWTGEGGEGVIL
jgi:glutaredoxin